MAKRPSRRVRQATQPRRFPTHLAATPQVWRAQKRQEWLAVEQALRTFEYGAAYVPAHPQLFTIYKLVHQVREALDHTTWVAW